MWPRTTCPPSRNAAWGVTAQRTRPPRPRQAALDLVAIQLASELGFLGLMRSIRAAPVAGGAGGG